MSLTIYILTQLNDVSARTFYYVILDLDICMDS